MTTATTATETTTRHLPVLVEHRDVWALTASLLPSRSLAVGEPPTLEELLKDCSQATGSPYLMYLRSLPSPRSQATMASACRTLLAQLSPDVPLDPMTWPWHALTAKETSAIRASMMRKFSPASVNKNLSALRGVVTCAWQLGLMTAEERDRAVHPRVLKAVPNNRLPAGREVTAGELRTVDELAAADPRRLTGARDAAILAVLHGAGLRRAEASGLDLGDYDPATGRLTILAGKGGKQRVCFVAGGAKAAVDDWLSARATIEPALTTAALFVQVIKSGRPIDRRLSGAAILTILRRRADQAGLSRFGAHDLRRTFAGDHFSGGTDVAILQRLMGHSSIVTTGRYDRRPLERAGAAAGNINHFHTSGGLFGADSANQAAP